MPPGATLEYEISLISFQAKPGTPATLASQEKASDLQRLKEAREGREEGEERGGEEARGVGGKAVKAVSLPVSKTVTAATEEDKVLVCLCIYRTHSRSI